MNFPRLLDQLKKDEGFASEPYWDNDHYTWGFGTRAPGPHVVITKEEADFELQESALRAYDSYINLFHTCDQNGIGINDVREEALTNMIYNLGITRFKAFRKMIAAITEEDWKRASYEALNSLWAKQVPKRANRIARELETGAKET